MLPIPATSGNFASDVSVFVVKLLSLLVVLKSVSRDVSNHVGNEIDSTTLGFCLCRYINIHFMVVSFGFINFNVGMVVLRM